VFKVFFNLKNVEYELVAADLDLSHPYFVSIKDFDLDYDEGLVVNPHLENTRKRFRHTETIMIPFQSCSLIEKVPARKRKEGPALVTLKETEEES
jgi:hypothetical protein